jgi:hypothetical protein
VRVLTDAGAAVEDAGVAVRRWLIRRPWLFERLDAARPGEYQVRLHG